MNDRILQINQSGAWRNVISFPEMATGNVRSAADSLVCVARASSAKLRICEAINNCDGHGIKAGKVLESWSAADEEGWHS